MDFLALAKQRYSVRKYTTQAVEEHKVQSILEAGRVAPTAVNKQPQHILVLQTPHSLAKINKGANTFGAPLVFLVCGNHQTAWVRPYDAKSMVDTDTSIVTTQMMLQATALGLGSCWITYFDPAIIRQEFALPPHLEPVNMLAVGYGQDKDPSPQRHDSARKALADMISYEKLS